MNYLSVCSGIEAATVAWRPLGWSPLGFSEIEKFPSRILAHHYPNVRNYGDITNHKRWDVGDFRLLVGGTPCQPFSVAGLRKGMADPRGNLSLTYLGIVDDHRPDWFVWENVPGVLSSWSGAEPPSDLEEGQGWESVETSDFGCFLAGITELGYGFAYRVLDAQYVRVDGYGRAVPQRRRRVFVVGNSRSWRRAAAVLFERESLSGNSAPRREAGEGVAVDVAPSLVSSGRGVERTGETRGQDPVIARPVASTLDANFGRLHGASHQDLNHGHSHLVAFGGNDTSGPINVATARNAHGGPHGRLDFESETFVVAPDIAKTLNRGAESAGKGGYAGRRQEDDDNLVAHPYTLAIRGRDGQPDLEYRQDGTANAILTPNGGRAGIGVGAVAFTQNQRDEVREMDVAGALAAEPGMKQQTYVNQGWAVRRLTPTECERLQGFPDGYTNIGKSADGPRYKALGNSMAVNAMRWIGTRIQMVDEMTKEKAAEAA